VLKKYTVINIYIYDKTVYGDNNREKVIITCPIHGDFLISPVSFLSGSSCKYCKIGNIFTTEDFIREARKIHGDKYDYSKSIYGGMYKNITITCPIHGDFTQKPVNHIKKHNGCQECAKLFRISESKLYNFLCDNLKGINIIHSYHNKNILYGQELDIFIKEYNIAIEYQGEQHFKPVDFGGYGVDVANKQFIDNKNRDIKKNKICKQVGIKLLYYSDNQYDDFLGEKLYTNKQELLNDIKQLITEQVIKKESDK